MNCECCSSRGVLEKFNIHRVLFCNINICFGHFLWNSLSQRFEEYVSTLHSKCIPAKLNWESSLPPSLVDSFPPAGSKSFPWHWRHLLRWNCDLPTCLGRCCRAETWNQFCPLGRDSVCPLTSGFIFQVFFWYKQFCLSYHCSFLSRFLWGIIFPEKMWLKVISNSPHLLLLGYKCLFTLTVWALFPSVRP